MKKITFFVLSTMLIIFISAGCSNMGANSKIETSSAVNNQSNVYENKKLGFSLEFPSTWVGNYIVNEYDDCINICFIGESETSKQIEEGTNKIQGISMFYIGNESCLDMFADSINEVGMVNEVKYFYFTDTDYPLGALDGEYIENEKEKELAKKDLEKATQMRKDIDSILSTFKAIR